MISEELMSQVMRYSKMRSFSLNENLKNELSKWYVEFRGTALNSKCGTCVRNAMRDLCREVEVIKSQEAIKPAKIQFIGVKQYNYDRMSYNEMKALAKDRGLILGAAPKKADLLKALKP